MRVLSKEIEDYIRDHEDDVREWVRRASKPDPTDRRSPEDMAREWLSAEEQMAKANWPMGRPSEIYVASLAALIAFDRAERAQADRDAARAHALSAGDHVSPAPTGDRLIAYLKAVRAASERARPDQPLLADAWHMGWIARRVGRKANDGPCEDGQRATAWLAGWEAARGTWEQVGTDYLPRDSRALVR